MTSPQPGPPQPSVAIPQLNPWLAQLCGVHSGVPHMLGAPNAPQTWHVGQPPQSRAFPHPSVAMPQPKPCSAQVSATHPLLELLELLEDVALLDELVALVVEAPL